jgi:valyl-tRNA synthetase
MDWVVGRAFEAAIERAKVLAPGKKFVLEKDEDVLYTWFSSALWPFSIVGWPDKASNLSFSTRRL